MRAQTRMRLERRKWGDRNYKETWDTRSVGFRGQGVKEGDPRVTSQWMASAMRWLLIPFNKTSNTGAKSGCVS